MGSYTIFEGFENPRRGRQARNLTTNVPKILDFKSSSEQIFSRNCRWVPLKMNHFIYFTSRMSDGIFDGIFPIVHRTFLLSYFRGCRLLDFFFVLKVCGHIMKRLSSWRCPFVFLNRRLRYNSMAISFVTKLNFW